MEQDGVGRNTPRNKSSGGRNQHAVSHYLPVELPQREKPKVPPKPLLPVPPGDPSIRKTKWSSTLKAMTVIKTPPATYRSPGLNVSFPVANQNRPHVATSTLWRLDPAEEKVGGGDIGVQQRSRSKPKPTARPDSVATKIRPQTAIPEEKTNKKTIVMSHFSDQDSPRSRTSTNQEGEDETPESEESFVAELRASRVVHDPSKILQTFLAKNLSKIELQMFRSNPLLDPSKFYKTTTEFGKEIWEYDRAMIRDNLTEFVKLPVPIGCTLKCEIIRQRRGLNNGLYPSFVMFLQHPMDERTGASTIYLMTARKRKKTTTSRYIISTDPWDLTRDKDAIVGKVRANAIGTEFAIFDGGYNPNKAAVPHKSPREELGAIGYEKNFMGMKGPRKLKLLIPAMINANKRFERHPDGDHDTILENHKKGLKHGMLELQNKTPIFNPKAQIYMLNFEGRVKETSIKNFQIIHENLEGYIILQSGRVTSEKFILDIQFPLCPLQAFGIALTSFAGKLASE